MPTPGRRFEWEDVAPGLCSDEFRVTVTTESVRNYALATGDPRADGPADADVPVPPGYIFVAAPQRRHATMASAGCWAPEQDPAAPLSTPYVGSDVRYGRPLRAGETVLSVTRLLRRFERGGARFVVFGVEARDGDGGTIADYDYTCLWERGAGRTRTPRSTGVDRRGDAGPVLVKRETGETILAYGRLPVDRPGDWMSTHTHEEFARTAIFGGAVNAGVATAAYTVQWLEMVEPAGALWGGGRLESRALAPVRAGDTLRISGVEIEPTDSVGWRRYEILAVNQDGAAAFRSVATVPVAG